MVSWYLFKIGTLWTLCMAKWGLSGLWSLLIENRDPHIGLKKRSWIWKRAGSSIAYRRSGRGKEKGRWCNYIITSKEWKKILLKNSIIAWVDRQGKQYMETCEWEIIDNMSDMSVIYWFFSCCLQLAIRGKQ